MGNDPDIKLIAEFLCESNVYLLRSDFTIVRLCTAPFSYRLQIVFI